MFVKLEQTHGDKIPDTSWIFKTSDMWVSCRKNKSAPKWLWKFHLTVRAN